MAISRNTYASPSNASTKVPEGDILMLRSMSRLGIRKFLQVCNPKYLFFRR